MGIRRGRVEGVPKVPRRIVDPALTIAATGSSPVGATKVIWLMFEGFVFEDIREQDSNTELVFSLSAG
jgi:hypothetical protein